MLQLCSHFVEMILLVISFFVAMPEEKEILNADFNSKMLLKGLSYTELEASPC